MRVLITGSNGFIGRSVCSRLSNLEVSVRAMVRGGKHYKNYPCADEIVYGELPYNLPSYVMEGVDTVIHLACPTKGQNEKEAYSTTVEGTATLIELFKKHHCSGRFIFVSSQSAKESTTSAYGKTKYQAESIVKNSGIPYVILRPGLVIGGEGSGLFSRIVGIVKKLPIIPLPNHGNAIVQPIDIDTLSLAIGRCLGLPEEENYEFNLGDPEGITFRDMMRIISLYFHGKKTREISFPIFPVKIFVAILNAFHIPFPISIDNLRGFENIEKMQTGDSLKALGIDILPVESVIKNSISKSNDITNGLNPLRILLVGAGKIGIVHALDLLMREGIDLVGIVDKNRGARKLYKSMGIETVYENDLDRAIKRTRPDGIIIATPVTTHYPISKKCLEAGIPILVEKPVALTGELFDDFIELSNRYNNIPFHVGYMAAQYPHLDTMKELLAEGTMGKIVAFHAIALQSHIMATKPLSWEMVLAKSGGGVLLNYAGHMIAIIQRLLGMPDNVECRAWTRYSEEVEDAAEVMMHYAGFKGRLFTSWSIEGYAAPMQKIIINFEYGKVILDNTSLVQYIDNKLAKAFTVADYSISTRFNIASDYTGAGFSREHLNFARTVQDHNSNIVYDSKNPEHKPSRCAVTIQEAMSVEKLIQRMYSSMNSDVLSYDYYVTLEEFDSAIDAIINDKKMNWHKYHRDVK